MPPFLKKTSFQEQIFYSNFFFLYEIKAIFEIMHQEAKMLIVFNDHAQQGGIKIKTKLRGHFRQYKNVYNMFFCFLFSTTKSSTAGPWLMRFFRLGKIRIFQIRMTEIQVSRYVICLNLAYADFHQSPSLLL